MAKKDAPQRVYLLARTEDEIHPDRFASIEGIETRVAEVPDPTALTDASVLLVAATDPDWAAARLAQVRGNEHLFLKPVAVVGEPVDEATRALADAALSLPLSQGKLTEQVAALCEVAQHVAALPVTPPAGNGNHIADVQALRFLATRPDYALTPVPDVTSKVGYSYPLLCNRFALEPGAEMHVLEAWERLLLVQGTLIDRINLCPFCGAYNINFREVCPGCASLRMEEEVMLHHYRCGFVGPEHDFKKGERLACPKCNHLLRHIGVDYDKPSHNLCCADCKLNFTEPLVSCLCLRCRRAFGPENAVSHNVASYSLTDAGRRAAEEGIFPEFGLAQIFKNEFGFYRPDLFREFLKLESHRCVRYEAQSSLVQLHVDGVREIAASQGLARGHQMRREFADLLKEQLRETDILTFSHEDELVLLLTHTPASNADVAFKRIEEQCKTLFVHELHLAFTVKEVGEQTLDVDAILGHAS